MSEIGQEPMQFQVHWKDAFANNLIILFMLQEVESIQAAGLGWKDVLVHTRHNLIVELITMKYCRGQVSEWIQKLTESLTVGEY